MDNASSVSVNIQSVNGCGDKVLFHNGSEWKFGLIGIAIETYDAKDVTSDTLEKDKL